MEEIDLYSGFEGEAEISFSEKTMNGTIVRCLRLWYGHFDAIMQSVLANEKGSVRGVAHYYQTHTGWYECELWECNEKNIFFEQLATVNDLEYDDDTSKALSELRKIVLSSVESGNKLVLGYD